MRRLKVYLAADFDRKAELKGYANDLWDADVIVTSSWLDMPDVAGQGSDAQTDSAIATMAVGPRSDAKAEDMASLDLRDVQRADLLVAFTTGFKARGGRHVETGVALSRPGRRVLLVGPRENVFHFHPAVTVFQCWGDALACIKDIKHGNAPLRLPTRRAPMSRAR